MGEADRHVERALARRDQGRSAAGVLPRHREQPLGGDILADHVMVSIRSCGSRSPRSPHGTGRARGGARPGASLIGRTAPSTAFVERSTAVTALARWDGPRDVVQDHPAIATAGSRDWNPRTSAAAERAIRAGVHDEHDRGIQGFQISAAEPRRRSPRPPYSARGPLRPSRGRLRGSPR